MMLQKHTERIVSTDIFRGFALLGTFFVNVPMMQHKKNRADNKSFKKRIF